MPRAALLKELTPGGGDLPSHTSIGGYPIYYITKDGGKLCPGCANGKNGSEAANPECQDDPQWELVASDVNYEDGTLTCAHCEADIEVAYDGNVGEGECPGCPARVGQLHEPGCDLEQCPLCGLQLLSCEHAEEEILITDANRIPVGPKMRGVEDAERLGLWAKMVPGLRGWQPCGKDEEGACPDLNRLYAFCLWNPATRRFEAPRDEKTQSPLPIPTFPVQPQ